MTTINSDKRQYHDFLDSPVSYDDAKKAHIKTERKPAVDADLKLKRNAQNRAAQRAYRERKEKKMKDLEDKVKDLEDENTRISTESDFLKAQVDMLKNELMKVRGGNTNIDFASIKLPTKVGKLSTEGINKSTSELDVYDSSSNSSVQNSSPDTEISKHDPQLNKPQIDNLPDLISGSSNSTSPLNDNILLDSDSRFDEKVDPFCSELSQACSTKDSLLPKYQNKNTAKRNDSIFGKYFETPKNDDLFNDNIFGNSSMYYNFNLASPNNVQEDPLSFLNENNFDVNLAFDDNKSESITSSIDHMTTEESVYDPLQDYVNTNYNFNDFIKSSLPTEPSSNSKSDDDNEVVPAPETTYKCSEIWNRITSHPRYTEIDIDGLCAELKNKAKCSEKGVVINSTDVNALLEASAQRR